MLNKVAVIMFALLLSGSLFAEKVDNLAEGKALAAKLNKPLLLDFMTDW
jgi:hypothetical protein